MEANKLTETLCTLRKTNETYIFVKKTMPKPTVTTGLQVLLQNYQVLHYKRGIRAAPTRGARDAARGPSDLGQDRCYYSSTTKYYSVLRSTTPVLQSTTPVLQRTTKYYSRTTKYYTTKGGSGQRIV